MYVDAGEGQVGHVTVVGAGVCPDGAADPEPGAGDGAAQLRLHAAGGRVRQG